MIILLNKISTTPDLILVKLIKISTIQILMLVKLNKIVTTPDTMILKKYKIIPDLITVKLNNIPDLMLVKLKISTIQILMPVKLNNLVTTPVTIKISIIPDPRFAKIITKNNLIILNNSHAKITYNNLLNLFKVNYITHNV